MKFIIYAEVDIEDEKRAGLLKDLAPLIDKVRLQTGCVKYDWCADSSHGGRINVYEEWENKAALSAHFSGDNFKVIGSKINAHGILGASARKFTIHQEGPVFNESGSASVEF